MSICLSKSFNLETKRAAEVAAKPLVMGVLNVTPDSFSDGGNHLSTAAAYDRAMQMCQQGAAIIDVGGESTRPGAALVSVDEELERVVPVIEQLKAATDVVISIDTSKAEVMSASANAGADLINDVCALTQPNALRAAAETGLPVCLMHMQGKPQTMQKQPKYECVVEEVLAFLEERLHACTSAGIDRDKLIIDPGFGFGKTLQHNLQLFAGLPRFQALRLPILIGVSRKSMFGQLLDRDVDQRLAASVAMAALAVDKGVAIIRAHDVAETCDAVDVAFAVANAGQT